MEGITNDIYRTAYHKYFYSCDKYFAPFIAPNQNKSYNSKELRDVLPENNQGFYLVPQLLTNKADQFIKACKELNAFGYQEFNLNLGCPSGTVVAKYKGSGFLSKPLELDQFLEQVFSELDYKISIKTRLGRWDSEEFDELIEIYNKYPLEELIIHPRVQTDYYKNTPNLEAFSKALEKSKCSVCYNGDLFSEKDIVYIKDTYKSLSGIMLGRGIIANPFLLEDHVHSDTSGTVEQARMAKLKAFHDEILEGYRQRVSGEKDVLFRMKELWFYMFHALKGQEMSFGKTDINTKSLHPSIGTWPDTKYAKKIRKVEKLAQYEEIINEILQ